MTADRDVRDREHQRKPIEQLPIPAFPPIAIRVLQLVSEEDVEIKEVMELVRVDAAFSAQLLRRANSAAFGLKSQVESVQHALVVLGLRRIKILSMTVATRIYLQAALQIDELRRCWRHTLACALLTEELARVCGVHQDRAYTAGLLHDIGRTGLVSAYPGEYAALLREAAEAAAYGEPLDLLRREAEAFGADHCEAGRRLIAKWKLPEEFAAVAAQHHAPPAAGQIDLVTLTSLGCRLADALGFDVVPCPHPSSLEEIQAALPPDKRNRFSLDPEPWRDLVESKARLLDLPDFDIRGPKTAAAEVGAIEPPIAAAVAAPHSWARDAAVVIVYGLILAGAFIALQQFFVK